MCPERVERKTLIRVMRPCRTVSPGVDCRTEIEQKYDMFSNLVALSHLGLARFAQAQLLRRRVCHQPFQHFVSLEPRGQHERRSPELIPPTYLLWGKRPGQRYVITGRRTEHVWNLTRSCVLLYDLTLRGYDNPPGLHPVTFCGEESWLSGNRKERFNMTFMLRSSSVLEKFLPNVPRSSCFIDPDQTLLLLPDLSAFDLEAVIAFVQSRKVEQANQKSCSLFLSANAALPNQSRGSVRHIPSQKRPRWNRNQPG